ncbi:penicillin acylase family protein [uncultured Imperialibacter sp.]|uniref:penicillin acylase family protein n=1 Tax=uncultured Imperialibacter sp. TaxID=1672639 RepID=UPI0030DBC412|tara:strand:- start:75436 stop:77862 length:2427 start_codon:yes stop_codon:yes gene_type:complete
MKVFKFVFFTIITIVLVVVLNSKNGNIPPLGKFLNPMSGFWANSEYTAIKAPEQLTLEGLEEPVKIYWDKDLIPHIFAENDHDLYFAEGYTIAFHRLWQMEFQLYKTAGRLSEILGPLTLSLDQQQRRKGLAYSASWMLEEVKKDKAIYEMLQAYSDGVNAYIATLDYKDLPIEYKLLDYEPEPFSPYKICLLLKEMSDQLSSGEADLENTNMVRLLGKDTFNFLFPDRDPGIDPIITAGTKFDFEPLKVANPNDSLPLAKVKQVISKPDPKNGSNSFAVAGNKTASGHVLLANEPDLGLNLPSIWYAAHLHSPSVNVMGAVFPGSPGITIGFTDSIAFGFTNAKRDVADWFYIQFRNDDRDEYLYDGKWLKTQKVIEEIIVRGEDTKYDTVIYTHFGPVTYDRNFKGNGEQVNFAFRWTAHDTSNDFRLFYHLNRGKNYNDYLEGLNHYSGPPQNIVYGDVHGNIAMWVQGKFPVKYPEQGKFLMDGRYSKYDWGPFIPQQQNIHELNPARNFVSSANQHPADATYPYYVYDYNYEHYRNRRINDRLKIMQGIKPEDMMRLQNDNYNYLAYENLTFMLDSLDTGKMVARTREAYQLLRKWDYFNDPERVAPVYFEEWWDQFYAMLWDEFDTMSVAAYKPHNYHTSVLMKNNPTLAFADLLGTSRKETIKDVLSMTFASSLDSVESWKNSHAVDLTWANFKSTTIQHLMRLEPFSVSNVQIGGNHGIVNAASRRHGPSWRMVVELDKAGVKAWGVYPGSQTGNPGNPTYADMVTPWATGKYLSLQFTSQQADLAADATLVQTLNPSKK